MRALKKIYKGRVKHKHGAWCLEREKHGRVSRGMLETEHYLQEREKEREKVRAGSGLREREAGYETNSCGDFRVKRRGLYAERGGRG